MPRLINIQILRAVAALFVVVFHCGLEMSRIADVTGQAIVFDHGRWNAGVSLFFAISGFIMVVTCRDGFGRPGEALAFLQRRLVRIAPIYWLLTVAVIVLYSAAPDLMRVPPSDPLAMPLSFLFWPFARPDGEVRPLVTPGWTLNLEVYFYAIFACGLLFRRAAGLALIAATIAGVTCLRMAGAFSTVALNFWGDPIVLGFLFGMAIGCLHDSGWRVPLPAAAALVIAGFVLASTGGARSLPEDALLARLSTIIPAALILAGATLGPQVERTSLSKPFILLGDASYSLYLVHEFGLRPLRLIWSRIVGDALPLWTFLIAGLALSVTMGLVCYYCVEVPLGRLFRRRRPIGTAPARPSGAGSQAPETLSGI